MTDYDIPGYDPADVLTTDQAFGEGNLATPAQAQAALDAIMERETLPSIPNPEPGFLTTPSGIRAEVRELNGEHEERIAKVGIEDSIGRWVQIVLECGVVSLNDAPATSRSLQELLIGDREYLLMAISSATYGDEIDMGILNCPGCKIDLNISIDLMSDIPVKKFDGASSFEVSLKNGATAEVRLPTGADQLAFFEDAGLSDAERKTVMLSRCVIAKVDAKGNRTVFAGYPSLAKTTLSVPDRNTILNEITKRQPGPRYDGIVVDHECGAQIPLQVGLMHLFPGL